MMMRRRASQDIFAGVMVVAFGVAVLATISRIPTAKFQAIGAALFPQVCASALIACGLALLLRGVLLRGEAIVWPKWRGTALILVSVVTFGFIAPRLGYAVAGFVMIIIAGFASKEVKPQQLFIFAAGMIAFCVVLFSVVLKVPIPAIMLSGFRF